MNDITPTVKWLLITNIIVYAVANSYTILHVDILHLNDIFPLYNIGNPNFRLWQLITHMFMHDPSNLMHIGFNMFALYSFGSLLEKYWGAQRFLFFYISCGLGAAALQLGINYFMLQDTEGAMLGASGAIYGLLAAFAFMFPDAQLAMFFIPVPIKAKYFVPLLVGYDLFSGVTGSTLMGGNIAHFAHIGGALVGILIMLLWRNNRFQHNRWN